ncbi:hypothetical protein DU508_15230 [Pedobacter chinensis]|uniref:Lipocalin-like domain-containing protein n=1 Tax=Pedobacter chinensis TaxID=2282421 RepID=A0A369PY76_9SPHI|nr:hypothetical protein [Pedobacter chinensis]RDC55629.1 hypothetical protein DU508_15230 [Pedobacter chinensis]
MKSKFISVKTFILPVFIIALTIFLNACKKDQLKVDQEKVFLEADFKFDSSFPYNGGWQVTLKPNGKADILPGGDIVWGGTYKISGKNLTIKSDNKTFKFEILSETEIKEKEYGVLLRLK